MDDDSSETTREETSWAQQAWAEWMRGEYLDRNSIQAAHRAFLAGYDKGYSDADAGG